MEAVLSEVGKKWALDGHSLIERLIDNEEEK